MQIVELVISGVISEVISYLIIKYLKHHEKKKDSRRAGTES